MAVAHALNKDFIAQFGDLAKPWNQLISSTTAQSDPEGTTVYEHDPAEAARLVEESDYDGTPVKIVYDVSDPYTSANSTSLAQDLEAAGFTVDLQGLQQTEFFTAIYDPALYDISSTYWSADYPDAQDFISTNFICGTIDILNISRFCDESIDDASSPPSRWSSARARRRPARCAAAAHRRGRRRHGDGGDAPGAAGAGRRDPNVGHLRTPSAGSVPGSGPKAEPAPLLEVDGLVATSSGDVLRGATSPSTRVRSSGS